MKTTKVNQEKLASGEEALLKNKIMNLEQELKAVEDELTRY